MRRAPQINRSISKEMFEAWRVSERDKEIEVSDSINALWSQGEGKKPPPPPKMGEMQKPQNESTSNVPIVAQNMIRSVWHLVRNAQSTTNQTTLCPFAKLNRLDQTCTPSLMTKRTWITTKLCRFGACTDAKFPKWTFTTINVGRKPHLVTSYLLKQSKVVWA